MCLGRQLEDRKPSTNHDEKYSESTRRAKGRHLLCIGIFYDANISADSVKRFQKVKQTVLEYFPDLTMVVLSLYQQGKSSSSKQRKYGKVAYRTLIYGGILAYTK